MVINLCGKKVMFMSYGKKPYLDSMGIGITKCDKKDYNVWQIGPLQSVTRIGFKYNNCRIKKFDKMDYKVQQ